MSDKKEETTTETGKSDFETFTSQALRLRQRGSFELLISQHLATATPADTLTKIRLVCESAYMVPTDKLQLDMKQVETLYMSTQAFLCSNIKNDFVTISWGFPQNEKNFKRFVKPWHRNIPLFFVYENDYEAKKKIKLLNQAETEATKFFLFTDHLGLTIGSFQILKVQFLVWAIPKVMELFSKISKLIDPDLYKEMLAVLHPQKGE